MPAHGASALYLVHNILYLETAEVTVAFTFPGQGSQSVGMGRELAGAFPAARAVFDEVDEALGERLSATMWDGPEDALTLTKNAQPALMAVSIAVVAVMDRDFGISVAGNAAFVAGHSLGEYSALAAAGTFSVADTARLLRTRGEAMQAATPVGTGAMAALLGLDFEAAGKVAEEAAQGDVCQAANDNAPGQVVVSGSKAAVERAVDIARQHGARRAMLLPVSAPFHCALMQPAADIMAGALAGVAMMAPSKPLVANVLACAISEPDQIRENLVAQVTGTVRWRESVAWMVENGVSGFVEVGTGKVLTGMARRMAPEASCLATTSVEDIEAVAQSLRG